jgi:hypothetical protein
MFSSTRSHSTWQLCFLDGLADHEPSWFFLKEPFASEIDRFPRNSAFRLRGRLRLRSTMLRVLRAMMSSKKRGERICSPLSA